MLSRFALRGSLTTTLPQLSASHAFRTYPRTTLLVSPFNVAQSFKSVVSRNNASLSLQIVRNLARKLERRGSSLLKVAERFGPVLLPVGLGGLAFLENGVTRSQCKVKDRRVGLDAAEKTKDPPFNWGLFFEFLKPQVSKGGG